MKILLMLAILLSSIDSSWPVKLLTADCSKLLHESKIGI